ncbi:MAG TPA: undecaprenyl-diphosphate phosphatase, partial [Caulobacterales bacterium]|nr:undecaprenyl-diphosphate phosphatase [Caulobacterales bacterium]
PTMLAAFLHDFLEVKDSLTSDRAAEIGVGFLFAFLSAWVVVKPFLASVTRVGFGPFALYRILIGGLVLLALAMHMI